MALRNAKIVFRNKFAPNWKIIILNSTLVMHQNAKYNFKNMILISKLMCSL